MSKRMLNMAKDYPVRAWDTSWWPSVHGAMPTLLHVHHTTSPALHAMFEAVQAGATNPDLAGVEVVSRAALAATAHDVLAADGYLLGTPANLGYMSGALKHFFDQVYYPCLTSTTARPYGVYVHGNNDTTGAFRDRDGHDRAPVAPCAGTGVGDR